MSSKTRAADDFTTIRARVAELQREKGISWDVSPTDYKPKMGDTVDFRNNSEDKWRIGGLIHSQVDLETVEEWIAKGRQVRKHIEA